MEKAQGYPVPADENDVRAKKLIIKWSRVQFWRDITFDSFRRRYITRHYRGHLLWHLAGILIVAMCRYACECIGNVPAVICCSWIIAAVIVSLFRPILRLAYWEVQYQRWNDKHDQAIKDRKILLIRKQQY